jgi:hypothetical protein
VNMLWPRWPLAAIALAVLVTACAHADREAALPEEQFPDPTDPAYPAAVLKARAERIRDIETWQTSLDAVNQMINFQLSSSTRRDASGGLPSSSLQQMRRDTMSELFHARARLMRLEQKVMQDFAGEYPPWWPNE